MKYTVLFFAALAIIWIKYARALQEDTMDTYKSNIYLNEPSFGSSSSGILKSHNGLKYTVGRNKTLYVLAPTGFRILVSIRLIDLRPNRQDTLTLFTVDRFPAYFPFSNTLNYQDRRYLPQEDIVYYVPNGKLGITFTTGPLNNNFGYDGFELVYTVQGTRSQCYSDFNCKNGWCIAKTLKCDGHNHCGDKSSEKDCSTSRSGRTVGIIFGSIFLVIAIACGVCIVIRKSRRTVTETVISHPPPPINQPYHPPYQQPGTYYPPPPPPYSQGGTYR